MGIALLRGCQCHYTVVNIDREEYDDSKLIFWIDYELKQFSEGLQHQTNRKEIIFGFFV